MKKAIELFESIQPIRTEIRKRCLSYLKTTLKKEKGNRIDFYNEDGEPINGEFVSVTYDGGNHPEYASNAFSNVKAVFLSKNGGISLDTEDDDDYDINNVTWGELYDVACYAYEVLKKR